jgi:hypothetical protein
MKKMEETVAHWPVPRLISCNAALWPGAGDWTAITGDANAVCCPPCSLGKCGQFGNLLGGPEGIRVKAISGDEHQKGM